MIYAHDLVFQENKIYTRIFADSKEELLDFAELIGLNIRFLRLARRPFFEVYGTKLLFVLSKKIQYLSSQEFEREMIS